MNSQRSYLTREAKTGKNIVAVPVFESISVKPVTAKHTMETIA